MSSFKPAARRFQVLQVGPWPARIGCRAAGASLPRRVSRQAPHRFRVRVVVVVLCLCLLYIDVGFAHNISLAAMASAWASKF